MITQPVALYFGCLDQLGHYLHGIPSALSQFDHTIYPDKDIIDFPWNGRHMDGGLLKNSKTVDDPDGRVFWTCGGAADLWFAFYWWDRSGDKRGASNSGFYVLGFDIGQERAAFAFACQAWRRVVERQHFPLVLQERR